MTANIIMLSINVKSVYHLFLFWNQLHNFFSDVSFPHKFLLYSLLLRYVWDPPGFWGKGDKSHWSPPDPPESRWEWDQWKHRSTDRSRQLQMSLGRAGHGEETDLSVFLSAFPVSPGSVCQRLSGKGVVMAIWAGSSPLWCPGISALCALAGRRRTAASLRFHTQHGEFGASICKWLHCTTQQGLQARGKWSLFLS